LSDRSGPSAGPRAMSVATPRSRRPARLCSVTEGPNLVPFGRLDHDSIDRLAVGRPEEDVGSHDRSIQNAVGHPTGRRARCLWHAEDDGAPAGCRQQELRTCLSPSRNTRRTPGVIIRRRNHGAQPAAQRTRLGCLREFGKACSELESRLRRGLRLISPWCWCSWHHPVAAQHQTLCQRLRGHLAYYGITGNSVALSRFRWFVTGIWRKWRSRRCRRATIPCNKVYRLLGRDPLQHRLRSTRCTAPNERMTCRMPERARTDLWEPWGNNPLGTPSPELSTGSYPQRLT
jgi:hypothetical protein